jgi:predicted transcriptional regulator
MKQRPKKLDPIAVRLDADVREALDKIAAEQDRSLSYLLNLAARKFVEAQTGKRSK